MGFSFNSETAGVLTIKLFAGTRSAVEFSAPFEAGKSQRFDQQYYEFEPLDMESPGADAHFDTEEPTKFPCEILLTTGTGESARAQPTACAVLLTRFLSCP
jgi:hypothetical protein